MTIMVEKNLKTIDDDLGYDTPLHVCISFKYNYKRYFKEFIISEDIFYEKEVPIFISKSVLNGIKETLQVIKHNKKI